MRGFILLVAVALASAGVAAPETGSHVDALPNAPDSEDKDGEQAGIRVMNGLGRCQAHRDPKPAAAVLALPLADYEQGQAAGKMFGAFPDCMGNAAGEVRFTSLLVVGAFAEQLIADHKPRLDLATALPASLPVKPRNALEDIGDCVVGQDSQDVITLLKTAPTSKQETIRIVALKAAIGACLPANQTFKLSFPMIRSLIAVSAYRRLVSAPS